MQYAGLLLSTSAGYMWHTKRIGRLARRKNIFNNYGSLLGDGYRLGGSCSSRLSSNNELVASLVPNAHAPSGSAHTINPV